MKDKDIAQDIVQEIFVKLWEKRNNYDSIPDLKTYLYVSVKNSCLNYIRDKKQTVDCTTMDIIDSNHFFRDRLIQEETYRIISQAIDSLPPQSARIMKMAFEGKQNGEIAKLLQISASTVKTLKYNALKTLKIVLKDYHYILLLLLCENN